MAERDIPKSEWGPGPWQDEPDELHWRDERTGLPCMILRNTWVTGALCGYVGVPPGHAFHGWCYDDHIPMKPGDDEGTIDEVGAIPAFIHALGEGLYGKTGTIELGVVLRAHGGITLTGEMSRGDQEWRSLWWFGFDAGHAGDLSPRMNALLRQIMPPDEIELFKDYEVYRTIDYMKEQCAKLAFQLRQLETRVIETAMPEALKSKLKEDK